MSMAEGDFEGQVAIVTGAAMGIGKACAEAFAKGGAAVVIADIDAEVGAATTAAIQAAGGSALFVRTDVSVMAEMEAMAAETLLAFGGIDIIVNNAARALGGRVDQIGEEDWNTVINTNLTGVWRGMRV